MANIDNLSIEISSNSQSAVDGIKALRDTLDSLKNVTKGGLGLTAVANQVKRISDTADGINSTSVNNLQGLAKAIEILSQVGNFKLSASIANQITNIGTALNGLNIGNGAGKIRDLVTALQPLETLGRSSLSTTVRALNNLPTALSRIDTRQLYGQISALTRIMRPLADEMQRIANGFNAFPSRIQRLIQDNQRLTQSNRGLSTSYIDLWARLRMAYNGVKNVTRKLASFIDKSAEYNEIVNRFSVSMGQYAKDHYEYARSVGDIMGIDPAEWMGNEATFMALSSGFGIASDRAATMSQQLTQLGYDIASFHDVSFSDAMLKLQSGLAGELEPLRRIGYDLSVARLQQEAYTLGISKKVSAMTQAEKAELRYYTIMKQSTLAQGDMARTLSDPANQLRLFKAQVEQTARSIGNLFIPVLMKVLPVVSAVIGAIRALVDIIAGLLGYELPEIKWDGVKSLASGASDASSALSDATDNAKKLQKYTMGFDELNVIDPNQGSGSGNGSGGIGGSGFGFELPTYDFIGEETKNRISEMTEGLKEWLGIGDGITSWADLFHTRLGNILVVVGLIGVALLAWKAIKGIAGIVDVFSKLGGLGGLGGSGKGGTSANLAPAINTLKGLIPTLALGLVVILEVAVAASLIIGAIWLLGWELEQVGIAWQPVIENGGTVATAVGIGTAILIGVGVVTALLGTMGAPLAGQIAIGTGILAEVGIVSALFLAEIWVIGEMLGKIDTAWKPVLTDSGDVEKAIVKGTILLVAIGTVTALLGVATIASGGALPLAIGLGTAILIELGVAFKLFCDELVMVAKKLSDDLHPALKDLNKILPDLNTEMEDFIDFMKTFAEMTVEYTKLSAISGFSSTVDKIIGFFTTDPIKSLANDVDKQYKQSVTLNEKLDLANPELKTAITNLSIYKERIDELKGVADTIDTGEISLNGFTNLVTISKKIAEFGSELKKYYSEIKNIKVATMDNMVNCINDVIDFAVRIKNEVDTTAIDEFTMAINRLTTAVKNLPTSKTLTITAIYETSGTAPRQYATGGLPDVGQMFVARESGPELVGNIGRKTAVVNNEQIVASVSRGVAEANNEQNALLREQNNLLRSMLEKQGNVYLDGKKVTANVEKHQRERGRTILVGGVV